jgi:hypothetical protein
MLKNFLLPRLVENDPTNTIIFQQAGTLSHFSRYLWKFLVHFLEDGLVGVVQFCYHLRWTDRGGSILLPPDTTFFFILGLCKELHL